METCRERKKERERETSRCVLSPAVNTHTATHKSGNIRTEMLLPLLAGATLQPDVLLLFGHGLGKTVELINTFVVWISRSKRISLIRPSPSLEMLQ